MKYAIQICSFILFFCYWPLSAQTTNTEILGVWKYQVDNIEGMSIISPTHFIWLIVDKKRKAINGDKPSNEEKAKAYDALNVAAGTWTMSNEHRVKFTFTHHVNPKQIGQSFEWEYEKEADLMSYWILQEDGKRGKLSQAHQLADWDAPGTCSSYNGVWEYVDWNGIYLQCGIYGAWFILFDSPDDISSQDAKAKAFDELSASVAVANCKQEGNDIWNVLYAADQREERTAISTQSLELEPDVFEWSRINAKRITIGDSWRVRRIAR